MEYLDTGVFVLYFAPFITLKAYLFTAMDTDMLYLFIMQGMWIDHNQ